MPGSSPSADTRCAGCMPNGWCTSWTPSPIRNRAAQQRVRELIWNFYAASQGLPRQPREKPPPCAAGALRSHLPPPHRLRHPRSPAGAAACQQGRAADGARPAGDPAEYQRLRERHPLPGHPPQGQRRNTQRPRPRLPRCLPRPLQDRATSSAWRSGTISAAGSEFPVSASFRPCRTSSAVAGSPPDTGGCPGFCPYYGALVICYEGHYHI